MGCPGAVLSFLASFPRSRPEESNANIGVDGRISFPSQQQQQQQQTTTTNNNNSNSNNNNNNNNNNPGAVTGFLGSYISNPFIARSLGNLAQSRHMYSYMYSYKAFGGYHSFSASAVGHDMWGLRKPLGLQKA